jgi:hypothetical protein
MRILRLTRHPASSEQLTELSRIYGEVEVVEVSETVPHVERIKELTAQHNANVLEAVLPLSMMAQCLDPRNGLGIPIVRAVMERTLSADGSDATFQFSHYVKMVKVEVVTERL